MDVYVVFAESPTRKWWDALTCSGFRHCLTFIPCDEELWLSLDVVCGQISIRHWMENPVQVCADSTIGLLFTAVKFTLAEKTPIRYPLRLLTCVGLAKAAIGVRAWWVWTPKQLHTYLLKHGGEIRWRAS